MKFTRVPGTFFVIVGCLVASFIATFPLLTAAHYALFDPVDAVLNTWIVAWEHYAVLTDPRTFFNANIFFPHEQTLLYSETLLVPSLLALPLHLATGNAILTHNMIVVAGFTLTGMNGYLLGRWLFGNRASGWVIGTAFAFNSYTLSNLGQLQLLHLEWLPLALLYGGKLLQRPRARYLFLGAAYLAAQFYTTIYYGLFGFLIVGLVGGVAWLLLRYPTMQARFVAAVHYALMLGLALLLCAPLARAYFLISQRYGYVRTIEDLWPFSASLEMWSSAQPHHLLYGAWFGRQLPKLGYYPVDALLPGLFLVLIAGSGVVLWLARAALGREITRRSAIRWPLALLAGTLLFFVLSLGPYLQVKTLEPMWDTELPYAWLHRFVPGFEALRAPGRFAIFVYFGLAIGAAFLVSRIKWRFVRAVCVVLLAGEALALAPVDLFTPTVTSDERAAYAWLAQQPTVAFVELPLDRFGKEGAEARWLHSQFQSMRHWKATPVGYSGFFPPRYEELLAFLERFPEPEVAKFLQTMKLGVVLVHEDWLPSAQWDAIAAAIDLQGWEVDQWGSVQAIHLPPVDAMATSRSFFIPDIAQAEGTMGVGIVFSATTPTAVLPGGESGEIQVEWWQGPRRVKRELRVFQPPFYMNAVGVVTVEIGVPDDVGAYEVRVVEVATGQVLDVGAVEVRDEVARPERVVLPLRAVEAVVRCDADALHVDVTMETIGWFDEAITLTGRILDEGGEEIARTADVEFAPNAERSALRGESVYTLPVEAWPREQMAAAIDLIAYQWQQAAERVVPRVFVGDDGKVVEKVTLRLQWPEGCAAAGG